MKKLHRLVVACAAVLSAAPAASAHHVGLPSEVEENMPTLPGGAAVSSAGSSQDLHSDNMVMLANLQQPFAAPPGTTGANPYASPSGSDLAFWGDTAVMGIYDRPGGIRLVDIANPQAPAIVGEAACPGGQGDVSVWRDLVFMSVDSARERPDCGAPAAGTPQYTQGKGFEGIRIFDISNRRNPRQVAFVNTDCGSHTHTIYPDEPNGRVLIYVLSYPLGTPASNCNPQSHRKVSVVEVPLADPTASRVASTVDVSPTIGCHDMSVFKPRKLGFAACITESQIWDLSDPVNPKVIEHITNPQVQIHHSSAFSWDGNTAVLGDEMGGAIAASGCLDAHMPLGALWFYDVSDPTNAKVAGRYNLPESQQNRQPTILCTAHNFNVLPLADGRDVLSSAWYNGGVTLLDFTDPNSSKQLAWYAAKAPIRASAWAGYWYNGYVYANNFDASYQPPDPRSRGFDVFAVGDPSLQSALHLPYLNAQTQEGLPSAEVAGTEARGSTVRERTRLRARASRSGRVRVPVTCPADRTRSCHGSVRLRQKGRDGRLRTVGARGFRRIAPGTTRSVSVPLKRPARRALERRRSLRLGVVVRTAPERRGGPAAVSTRTLRVLAPR